MGLRQALRDGTYGVEMVLPPGIEVTNDTGASFEFVVPEMAASWWVFDFLGVSLDLSDEGWPTLLRDVERQTRGLFEEMFRHPTRPRSEVIPARTTDAAWSPVIECARVPLKGGTALFVLHRMVYEPGSEIIMGHLLAPTVRGLVEVRWVAATQFTGYREAIWVDRAMRQKADKTSFEHPGQAAFDDPMLDPQFLKHPLTVARVAWRWLSEHSPLQILRPQPSEPAGEIGVGATGYVLVPPPRFKVLAIAGDSRDPQQTTMNRASFSGSDGLDLFIAIVLPRTKRRGSGSSGSDLDTELSERARAIYADAKVDNIRVEIVPTPPTKTPVREASSTASTMTVGRDRPTARVIVEGDGHLGPMRMAAHSLELEDGTLVSLFLTTSATLPAKDMFAELNAAATTLRPRPAPRRGLLRFFR